MVFLSYRYFTTTFFKKSTESRYLFSESATIPFVTKNYRELFEPASASPGSVLSQKESRRYFSKIVLKETAAKDGDYRSLYLTDDLFENERLKNRLSDEFAAVLSYYFKKYDVCRGDRILVAGLGNDKVTADSLGPAVCDRLLVTSHLYDQKSVSEKYGNLSAIKCGVSGTTGIESFSLLSAVVEKERPKILLVVDALACSRTGRLARVLQCSDAGIEPGGGVANAKPILSVSSLRLPVVAVGVPTVMYARKILAEFCAGDFTESEILKTLTVAAKEIDYQIRDYADVIASGINNAVHRAKSRLFVLSPAK